jgi:hypothetical protein
MYIATSHWGYVLEPPDGLTIGRSILRALMTTRVATRSLTADADGDDDGVVDGVVEVEGGGGVGSEKVGAGDRLKISGDSVGLVGSGPASTGAL